MEPGNALNWFEISVADFGRAKKFYESIFDYEMSETQAGAVHMGFFQHDFKTGKTGGAICESPHHLPSNEGAILYLNCNPDLQAVLDRVEKAGGSILQPKIPVSPDQQLGFMAFIVDSEGNRVALHSME